MPQPHIVSYQSQEIIVRPGLVEAPTYAQAIAKFPQGVRPAGMKFFYEQFTLNYERFQETKDPRDLANAEKWLGKVGNDWTWHDSGDAIATGKTGKEFKIHLDSPQLIDILPTHKLSQGALPIGRPAYNVIGSDVYSRSDARFNGYLQESQAINNPAWKAFFGEEIKDDKNTVVQLGTERIVSAVFGYMKDQYKLTEAMAVWINPEDVPFSERAWIAGSLIYDWGASALGRFNLGLHSRLFGVSSSIGAEGATQNSSLSLEKRASHAR